MATQARFVKLYAVENSNPTTWWIYSNELDRADKEAFELAEKQAGRTPYPVKRPKAYALVVATDLPGDVARDLSNGRAVLFDIDGPSAVTLQVSPKAGSTFRQIPLSDYDPDRMRDPRWHREPPWNDRRWK